METLFIVLIGVAVFLAAAVVVSRRRAAAAVRAPLTEPRSMMHVIESEEELREALMRAAQIERVIAETALGRAAQYEEMLPTAPISDLVSVRAHADDIRAESDSAVSAS